MRKSFFILFPLTFLFGSHGHGSSSGASGEAGGKPAVEYKKITAKEAKEIMDSGASYYLVDARAEDEYAKKRIAGARLIPHTEIKSKAPAELPDKDKTILVYCQSGGRSAIASKALAELGYAHVYDFGGIVSWPYDTVSGAE